MRAEPSSVLEEQSRLTLFCVTKTNTYPVNIQWLFEGNILQEEDSDALYIEKLNRNQFGEYSCRATNRVGAGQANINITVRYKPYLQDFESHPQSFEAVINHPTPVEIMIQSFPRPKCAWTRNNGGKLASIKVTEIRPDVFAISSTVMLQKESQFGMYEIRARNPYGSLDIKINLVSLIVSIRPLNINCNVSSTIELQCFLNLNASSNWTSMWLHSIKGNKLEERTGITLGNKSTLTINFCDFQDIGDYTCTWSSGIKIYSSTYPATVGVYGSPILSSQNVDLQRDDSLLLSVKFYSVPKPISIIWLENDKRLHLNRSSLMRTSIALKISETEVQFDGFSSNLLLEEPILYDSQFSCVVTNEYGYMDVLIDKRLLVGLIKDGNTITKIIQTSTLSKRNTSSLKPAGYTDEPTHTLTGMLTNDQIYIMICGVVLVILFIVMTVFIKNQIRINQVHKRTDQQPVVPLVALNYQEREKSSDVSDLPQRNIENPEYEEIQFIPFEVETEDYLTPEHDSSKSGSDSSIERQYLELDHDSSKSGSDSSIERQYLELDPPHTYEEISLSRRDLQVYSTCEDILE
ncbi:B-cell receptor CD22-like [Mytilus trossulus]|uniref:B-cell receptor CD22-like n=1 Tax=Mytilus trossulus TaxID=6551 RepID=UPI003005BDA7